MKVFVAGATGALGKQLVPLLVEQGHEVTGMTRTPAKQDLIRQLGARPAVADALDPEAVAQAVAQAEPDAVVHELTDLSGTFARNIDKSFATTNRLRTEGTDHLLAAAKASGARRFIAQSFAGWPSEPTGGPVKSEDAPSSSIPRRRSRSRSPRSAMSRTSRATTRSRGSRSGTGASTDPGRRLRSIPPARCSRWSGSAASR